MIVREAFIKFDSPSRFIYIFGESKKEFIILAYEKVGGSRYIPRKIIKLKNETKLYLSLCNNFIFDQIVHTLLPNISRVLEEHEKVTVISKKSRPRHFICVYRSNAECSFCRSTWVRFLWRFPTLPAARNLCALNWRSSG